MLLNTQNLIIPPAQSKASYFFSPKHPECTPHILLICGFNLRDKITLPFIHILAVNGMMSSHRDPFLCCITSFINREEKCRQRGRKGPSNQEGVKDSGPTE